jgi:hypothetical protein
MFAAVPFTGMIPVSAVLLTASTYCFALSVTSLNEVWLIGIFPGAAFAIAYGSTMDSRSSSALAFDPFSLFGLGTILLLGLFFVGQAVERHRYHVRRRHYFLDFMDPAKRKNNE